MTTLELTNLETTLKNEITNILDYSYAKMQGWCSIDLAPLKKQSQLAEITLKENNVFLQCGKLKERYF